MNLKSDLRPKRASDAAALDWDTAQPRRALSDGDFIARGRPADLRSVLSVAVPAMLVLVAGWSRRWVADDAFINFRIVDQILGGHGVVFNGTRSIGEAE